MPDTPPPDAPSFVYGTAWKEEATPDLVLEALKAGFTAIDTANQRKHYHEAGVGEGLRAAFDAGVIDRDALFLQTKFTYRRGQDHRLPYDPAAPTATQVRQSFESSLAHLGVSHLESLVLHGPSHAKGLSDVDHEAWREMEKIRAEGGARSIGISNVSASQLELLLDFADAQPAWVQNRCYARDGWDAEVRAICARAGVVYQGFSLLTANRKALAHPEVKRIADAHGRTIPEVIFPFAVSLGILPLTGTTDPAHMRQDLGALALTLSAEERETLLEATT